MYLSSLDQEYCVVRPGKMRYLHKEQELLHCRAGQGAARSKVLLDEMIWRDGGLSRFALYRSEYLSISIERIIRLENEVPMVRFVAVLKLTFRWRGRSEIEST